ncbi:hypothetical protein CEP54_001197 [Fusarium duplospermum]|uniref:Uncharacterized protein n=1 Tax=Fusarium duplospermum TaxID=1325734 RepID=A0A428R243_9HYPO|nr:hypothetical protein CEP54_001197 [Fusarium duplospermum]
MTHTRAGDLNATVGRSWTEKIDCRLSARLWTCTSLRHLTRLQLLSACPAKRKIGSAYSDHGSQHYHDLPAQTQLRTVPAPRYNRDLPLLRLSSASTLDLMWPESWVAHLTSMSALVKEEVSDTTVAWVDIIQHQHHGLHYTPSTSTCSSFSTPPTFRNGWLSSGRRESRKRRKRTVSRNVGLETLLLNPTAVTFGCRCGLVPNDTF